MRALMLSAAVLIFSACAAGAYTDAGGRYTFGPSGYGGFNAFAEWGDDDYYLRPALNTYKSDLADRVSTYSLGGGRDWARWSAGGEVSFTPDTGGYKNSGVYADLSYALLPAPDEDAALQDLTLGVFGAMTMHEDQYAASTATVSTGRRGTSVVTLTSAFKLTQTDYGVTAGVKLWGLRASGRFTKTAYNKDVTAEARQLPIEIGGIGANGFPDTAVGFRLRAPGLPVVPEAGYTRTTYLLGQPASESVRLGLSFRTGGAELSAGWENFNPGGGVAKRDYYSAGVTLSF